MKQRSFASDVWLMALLSAAFVISACGRQSGTNNGGSAGHDREVTAYVSTDRTARM